VSQATPFRSALERAPGWLTSRPDLRGRVVLGDVCTFSCARTLEITFTAPGVRAYVLTFG
jgi:hypothetical protein